MARLIQYFGSNQTDTNGNNTGLETFLPYGARPQFPDLDLQPLSATVFIPGKLRPSVQRLADIRAFCLAGSTDWDAVAVFVDDEPQPYIVTPGVYVRLPKPAQLLRCEPLIQCPATRFANTQNAAGVVKPLLRFGSWFVDDLNNIVGPSGLQLYNWNGTAWVTGDVITPVLNRVTSGGNAVLANQAGGLATTPRPADVSPDPPGGPRFSFADYLATAQLVHSTGGVPVSPSSIFVSQKTLDSNGNLGDGSNPTTKVYVSPFLTQMAPFWYGVCALEVFTGDAPCEYYPRLPPIRTLRIGGNGSPVTINNSPVVGSPKQPLVTVPAINVDAAQWTWLTDPTAASASWGALGSPDPMEVLPNPANVTSTPAKAAIGAGAAVAILNNIHPFVQILMGSDNTGLTSLLQAGVLSLRRKVTG